MTEHRGRVRVGDGWTLVFDEPVLDDPVVEGDDESLQFSNQDMLVMPNVVPVEDGITDAWLLDWHLGAAARAVQMGSCTQDLGRIDGAGWSGTLGYGQLDDGTEVKLVGFMTGSHAILHLTVRFREPSVFDAARRLILAVEHDPAGVSAPNRP